MYSRNIEKYIVNTENNFYNIKHSADSQEVLDRITDLSLAVCFGDSRSTSRITGLSLTSDLDNELVISWTRTNYIYSCSSDISHSSNTREYNLTLVRVSENQSNSLDELKSLYGEFCE